MKTPCPSRSFVREAEKKAKEKKKKKGFLEEILFRAFACERS
jgi:hypothetical protein